VSLPLLNAKSLEGFVNSVLRKGFDGAAETPEFHREIWELICSDHRQVAIAAPRSHAKSTAVTYAFSLASTLFRVSDYVLIVSGTVSQSVQFLGDIKKELSENTDLRDLFGVKCFQKDTEDDLIVEMEDGHLFRIQAKGSEQKLRGLKWKNKRPNLILCDDMEEDESVMNKDRRLKFRRWFYGALLPCMSDKGKIRVVGTILHLDSLLENLMPSSLLRTTKDGHKKIIRTELKEYTDVKLPWKSVKYKAHNENYSAILWPEKKTKAMFIELREDYQRQGLGDVYSQEMLNVPLDEENAFFKKSDFHPMRETDHNRNMNYYITADLAVSQSQRADYTVFTVGGMDDEGRLHLVNVVRERMDSLQIVDTMLVLNKFYKPRLFGIEQGTIEKAIGPYLNAEMLKRGEFINFALLKPSADKLTRARSMQARMRSGACRFDVQADWYPEFEEELLKFPRTKHDDQTDAWAYLGLMLDKLSTADTPEEEQEEEYEMMRKESDLDQGRNLTTGY
jgi:predicted phage terminase large subunit-like protein